jgi:hypothetical protein
MTAFPRNASILHQKTGLCIFHPKRDSTYSSDRNSFAWPTNQARDG